MFGLTLGKHDRSILVLPQNNKGIRWFTVKIGVKRVLPIEMIDKDGLC